MHSGAEEKTAIGEAFIVEISALPIWEPKPWSILSEVIYRRGGQL